MPGNDDEAIHDVSVVAEHAEAAVAVVMCCCGLNLASQKAEAAEPCENA